MKKIGFIGLGVMGLPMCKNLLKAGFEIVVWNRTTKKIGEVTCIGAIAGSSPKEVAQETNVVIIMVGDSADVKDVVMGPSGLIEGIKKGAVVIDMSSISPVATQEIAKALEGKGARMLDAPVSGGETGAIEAALSIMVGGQKNVYEECLPILRTLGKRITYMGRTGSGQSAKLCNQVICALHIQAVCEGLMLGSKLGLDLELLLEILTAGYANSSILSDLGLKMIRRDFRPGFKMRHQLKDIKNALDAAAEANFPIPCSSLVYQLFCGVEAMGLGENGTQSSLLIMEKLADSRLNIKTE